MTAKNERLGSSFRDPAGFMFRREGRLFRRVSPEYSPVLDLLVSSGLYDRLVAKSLLIPHVEHEMEGRVLEPELVRTISYPYEWCFGQFKAAALATLRIHREALQAGLSLKDASAYNIQFHRGKPVLIDTLSFEPYEEGKPWRAYRQFCEHFLAPVALMSLVDVRLGRMSANYIDGIPLDLASKLLPGSSKFNAGLAMHLHLHAKAQTAGQEGEKTKQGSSAFGKNAMMGLIDSLEKTIDKLTWTVPKTVWSDYYSETNYSADGMTAKRNLVAEFVAGMPEPPQMVWDLGANTGEFSKIVADQGIEVVSWDLDPAAVERNYLQHGDNPKLLPLVVDLTNPSPALGWALQERESIVQRGNADLLLALALIHHLAIGNNVPLAEVARFFARLSPNLIIEFVPKSDSQVKRLLSSRDDIYLDYDLNGFEAAFAESFQVVMKRPIEGTERTLYLMERR